MDRFEDVLERLPKETREACRSLISHALELGYKARKDKTKTPGYSFFSTEHRQTVLRVVDNGKATSLRLKFYGVEGYSPAFETALKQTIEEYGFRYTGCYGCGRCPGEPLGYTIAYEDGRRYFRCGFELIELKTIDPPLVAEIHGLLDAQTRYWKNQRDQRVKVGAI